MASPSSKLYKSYWVINAAMIGLVAWFLDGFQIACFRAALLGAILVSLTMACGGAAMSAGGGSDVTSEAVAGGVSIMADLNEKTDGALGAALAFGSGAATIVGPVIAMAAQLAIASIASGGLAVSMSAILVPLLPIIAGVAILVGAYLLLTTSNEDLEASFGDFAPILISVKGLLQSIVDIVVTVAEAIVTLINPTQLAASTSIRFGNTMEKLTALFDKIAPLIDGIAAKIKLWTGNTDDVNIVNIILNNALNSLFSSIDIVIGVITLMVDRINGTDNQLTVGGAGFLYLKRVS